MGKTCDYSISSKMSCELYDAIENGGYKVREVKDNVPEYDEIYSKEGELVAKIVNGGKIEIEFLSRQKKFSNIVKDISALESDDLFFLPKGGSAQKQFIKGFDTYIKQQKTL